MSEKKPVLKALSFLLPEKKDPRTPEDYFSHLPVIETSRLILRPIRMSDAGDIFLYSSDPEVARYVLWTPHRSLGETRAFIRWMLHAYREAIPGSWAIELKESRHVVGTIGFMNYNRENNVAEVGYSIARRYWNKGVTTEALEAVLRSGFKQLGLHRIEAQYDVRNPASGRVMEKCGMRQEGLLRGRIFNKGEYIDVVLNAILIEEFESPEKFQR